MIIRKFISTGRMSQRLVSCMASALVLMLLGIGCTKEVTPNGEQELDLSKRTEVTLQSVAVASGGAAARAAGDTPMPIGSQFRMYVMAKGSENVIETRTYTILTKEGVPQMDADQSALLLPYGELDVYLVGPLSYTTPAYSYDDGSGTMVNVPEQTFPIAHEDRVTPQLGIDLISSLTTIEVLGTKDNTIVAKPLEHKMSQLDIVIERFKPEGGTAVYENMDMEYISIDNVALSGDFVFDANGGTITTSSSSTLLFSGDQIEVTLDGAQKDKFRVTEYVMPRPKKKSKIETKFSYNLVGELPGVTPKTRVFSGITSDSPFESGTRMQFSSMPVMGVDLIFRANLLPWDDGGNVVIDPPTNPELAVWYSGEDAPEDIYGDGKMYWRDRSGNGNHALIDKGLYDAAGKFYYPSPGSSPSFVVPPLWNNKNTDYTVELAAQTISATTNTLQFTGLNAIVFSNKDIIEAEPRSQTIRVDLPYGTTQFRSGKYETQFFHFAGGTPNNPADKGLHEQFHTFAFARTAGKGYTFVNGKLQQVNLMQYDWLAFNGPNNNLWIPVAVVAPHNKKMRLYGVKIYRSCKTADNASETFGAANAELTANYITYLSRLAKSNIVANDYVKDGLILDLRGADITADGDTWTDRSGRGNHFKKLGNVGVVAGESYKFINDHAAYLKSTKSMGPQKEVTIEIVVSANCSDSEQLTLFHANNVDLKDGGGATAIYFPLYHKIQVGMPEYGGRFQIPMDKYPNGAIGTKSQICTQRRGNEVLFWQNGALPDVAPKITTDQFNDWNYVAIGANLAGEVAPSKGWVYAVRVYNRPLTEIERQHNYLLDKKTYNLLSNNP